MKKIILYACIFSTLISCKKSTDYSYNLAQIDGWTTINFKTSYTIQIPDGFSGPGMSGFEGNTFSKYSADNKINLFYAYCNDLFCEDFGESIANRPPESVQVPNNSGFKITLTRRAYFYQDSQIAGVFYYSNEDYSRGRLFWKDKNSLKAALEIDFSLSAFDTVNKIIGSIKPK